ncbi:nuclear transport factor 2 family protein [Lentzea sp. NBRC 105346]|uniref:nuclear transport factor 2 family protein n=1 Tax=Lentzea sp. NBRC 105346 TaxID=3032205 RepID=UPI0025541E8F|nr:nuclear transport factor 2 family protein [Lentzea sp. NBRC 105346]
MATDGLFAHCYRMLGSVQDAQDASRGTTGSERTSRYRAANNACLRLIRNRPRRMLPFDHGPACADASDLGTPVTGPLWVEPAPDDLLGAGSESVELPFVAALQHLPFPQRAVLSLCEEFSADETAEILDMTRASVGSTLEAARAAVDHPERSQREELRALGADGRRELVDALVTAWEKADVDGLLDLLTEDARFTMPPLPAWFDGRDRIRRFVSERLFATPWRLVPIRANAQLALACYQYVDHEFLLGAINLPHVRDGRISWLAGFVDPQLHQHFSIAQKFSRMDR